MTEKLGEQAYKLKFDHDKATAALEQSWQATALAKEQELKASYNALQQSLKTQHVEEMEAEKARWADQHSKTLASALLQLQQEREREVAEQTAAHAVALLAMETQHKVSPANHTSSQPTLITTLHRAYPIPFNPILITTIT